MTGVSGYYSYRGHGMASMSDMGQAAQSALGQPVGSALLAEILQQAGRGTFCTQRSRPQPFATCLSTSTTRFPAEMKVLQSVEAISRARE
jgi:hypothetical protein